VALGTASGTVEVLQLKGISGGAFNPEEQQATLERSMMPRDADD